MGNRTIVNDALAFDGGAFSLRNKIINGAMKIDQRNNGNAQTFTSGAALAYCIDRFYGYCTGANVTGQSVAGSGSTQRRYQFTGAASVTGIGFGQRIEMASCYDLASQSAVLSVDLANSLLTSVTWTAYYANTADTFGTLASPTRTQIATGTFTVTSTVTRYYANISVPAGATTGIEVVLSVGAQTSGTWTIGNVQLEQGTTATPFENRPFALEGVLCQRYYEESGNGDGSVVCSGYTTGGSSIYTPYFFKVTKRAQPVVTVVGTWGVSNCGQPASYQPGVGGCFLAAVGSGTGVAYAYNNSAGNRLTIAAEL